MNRYREVLQVCHRDAVCREPAAADWPRYEKCGICLAARGSPCTRYVGRTTNLIEVPKLHPCGGRRMTEGSECVT